MKKKPFFSIIIPTLNEEKYLPLLLSDLVKQTFTDFEVIVVDAESKDKTMTKARTFSGRLQLDIISTLKKGVSHQRNLGAKKAKAEWLIFMDADNRLPSHFLLGIKYKLETHPKTDLFTAWMDTKSYSSREEKLISQTYNIGLDIYKHLKKPTAVGALLGIKKTIFDRITFNKKLLIFEDHDLVQRSVKANYNFAIFSDPQYHYSFRRFKKEGTLKMLAVFISINLTSLLGSDMHIFEKYYPMNGGGYYDLTTSDLAFFSDLKQMLRQIPKKQLSNLTQKISALVNNAIS